MKSTMKLAFAAVLMFGISGATQSFAGVLDGCGKYAEDSAKQQQINLAKKCGATGQYWTTNLKKHVAFCKSVSPQKWKAEFKKRAQKIAACK